RVLHHGYGQTHEESEIMAFPFVENARVGNHGSHNNQRGKEPNDPEQSSDASQLENRKADHTANERDNDGRAVQLDILHDQMTNKRLTHATSSRLRSTLATKISSSVIFSIDCTRAPVFS